MTILIIIFKEEKMNKETIELIIAEIDKLAAKLGVASERLMPIITHQIQTGAILNILLSGILTVSLFCFCTFAKVNWDIIEDKEMEGVVGMAGLILAIMTLFSLIIGFNNLNRLLNPTYYAIERIVNMIH